MTTEKALTLHEVAKITGLSYGTIYANRQKLEAFRINDTKNGHWRVWPKSIDNLYKKRNNVIRIGLHADEELSCQSLKPQKVQIGKLTSARQAAKELGSLLAQRTSVKRRNITIG